MPRVKSRNYAEAYKWYAAQVILQIDPREIGSAFHPSTIVPTYGAGRIGAETCLPPADCGEGPFLDGN